MVFFCIVLFPIGLLALLAEKKAAMLLFSMEESEQGTHVIITGEAWGGLQKRLEKLRPPTA